MPRPWNRHNDCQHEDTAPARERCRYARLHADCDHPPTVHHGRVCEGKRDAVPHGRTSSDFVGTPDASDIAGDADSPES